METTTNDEVLFHYGEHLLATCLPGHYMIVELEGWKKLAKVVTTGEELESTLEILAEMGKGTTIEFDKCDQLDQYNLFDFFMGIYRRGAKLITVSTTLGLFETPSMGIMQPKFPSICRSITLSNKHHALNPTDRSNASKIGLSCWTKPDGSVTYHDFGPADYFYRLILEIASHKCKRCNEMLRSGRYFTNFLPLLVERQSLLK